MVGDLCLTSYGISVAGDVAGPLYVVLLWVIFGNGFRYGRKYLFASSAIGTISFGFAIYLNVYWSKSPHPGDRPADRSRRACRCTCPPS